MDNNIIITSLLSSSLAITVVTAIKEIIMWALNRKATTEDKGQNLEGSITKLTDSVNEITSSSKELIDRFEVLEKSLEEHKELDKKCFKVLYSDRIRWLSTNKIEANEITVEDKQIINELHRIYHEDLGGNGFFTELIKDVNELPIKHHNS